MDVVSKLVLLDQNLSYLVVSPLQFSARHLFHISYLLLGSVDICQQARSHDFLVLIQLLLEQALLVLQRPCFILSLQQLLGEFPLLLLKLLLAVDPLDHLLKLLVNQRVETFEL